MLLRKPKSLNPPLRGIRRPLDIKMPQYLGDQLPHFHNGNVLANTGARAISKLVPSLSAVAVRAIMDYVPARLRGVVKIGDVPS